MLTGLKVASYRPDGPSFAAASPSSPLRLRVPSAGRLRIFGRLVTLVARSVEGVERPYRAAK
jgi:hypothetical protein